MRHDYGGRATWRRACISPVAERRYLRLNGEEFWVSVSAAAIDYNQRPATLLFYRDITAAKRAEEEQARLEEQLRQAQKMESVGRLAGGVAHDFNNYLTVINGYCEMLLAGPEAAPGIRDGLQEIRAAGSGRRRSHSSCWRSAASRSRRRRF